MRGRVALLAAFAAAIQPVAFLTPSQWAQAERIVAPESGSPYPGAWDNARTPHLVEFMDCLAFEHPSRTVTAKKSAQTGFSEGLINAIARLICVDPCPILVLLPSQEEQGKYDRVKLQPTIDATPSLKARVNPPKNRDERGSTVTFKQFPGGFLQTTTASSSKGLQMISARFRGFEEVSEYPDDVDSRGEPTAIADARSIAWRERGDKAAYVSTPALKGACRVTAMFEAGDMRRWHTACPQCGHFQALAWEQMKWLREDRRPYGAHVVCRNGCVIEADQRPAMLVNGRWVKTYPSTDAANPAPPLAIPPDEIDHWCARDSEGRDPSFAFWQAQSPFVPWDEIVHQWLRSRGDPKALKAFYQQWLGEPWEMDGQAPPVDRLLERRQKWPRARLPAGVLFLTGSTDVQGDRLEWAVYGWGRGLEQYVVDYGVLVGDPAGDTVWQQLDKVRSRRYADAWGKEWPVDSWGIDAGYMSQRVYLYVSQRAASQRIFALDGRPGWRLPAIGTPKTLDVDYEGRKIGAVQLWPVGTWDLKGELYWSLRQTLEGPDEDGRWRPGCFWLNDGCDRQFLEQLTAEYLVDVRARHGGTQREWHKRSGVRNEQHDLAIYCRALARHETLGMTDASWATLEGQRLGEAEAAQLDLAALWAPGVAPVEVVPVGTSAGQPAPMAIPVGTNAGQPAPTDELPLVSDPVPDVPTPAPPAAPQEPEPTRRGDVMDVRRDWYSF